ncbi:MAG TPA: hypothetical protein VN380_07275 [Thermoanaerobaculia bacterium]|jgi:hypothetical protein|nr:hypothetical protein [Thermoanaerobaculia bacterium]
MGTSPDVSSGGARLCLIGIAAAMTAAAIVFVLRPPQFRWTRTSPDASVLVARIAGHPTDWEAASALAEVALDAKRGNRVALWHAAYVHASLLAPDNKEPATAFARDAFFHWTELSEKDKRDVMAAYGPLLRDPVLFGRMARPLFELTGDLSILHRAGPLTADTPATLISLALPNGLFADYRSLRPELQKKRLEDFVSRRSTVMPEELVAQFPAPPYHTDDEPLIRALLDELHRRPLQDDPGRPNVVDGIVDYASRHNLEPLDGLEIVTRKPGAAGVATQIKIARALGLGERAAQLEMASNDPRRVETNVFEWQGLCEKDLCTRAWRMIDAEHGVALTLETAQSDEVPGYVEIYIDDDLRAEGEVGPRRDFIVPVGNRGAHRIELVLVNPTTRNRASRRIHIASITAL